MKRILMFMVVTGFIVTNVSAQQIKIKGVKREGCRTELGEVMFQGIDTSDSRGVAVNELMWDNGTAILVKFMPGGSQAMRSRTMQYAKEWEQFANIKFQFVADNSPSTNIRVKLGGSRDSLGHNSLLGTMCNEESQFIQTMNLDTADFIDFKYYEAEIGKRGAFYNWLVNKGTDWNTYTYSMLSRDILDYYSPNIVYNIKAMRGTTLHEFGHALGLMHEQSYPGAIKWNKQAVYDAYYFWKKDKVDFNVLYVSDQYYTNGTAYDPKSIMHYEIDPALTLDGYSLIPTNELSPGDKKLIAALYPKDKKVSDLLLPKVTVVQFRKLDVKNNPGNTGVSIYPSLDLKSNAKMAEIYLVARLIFEDGGKTYYIKSETKNFNWGGYLAATLKLRLLPNSQISYNKTKQDLKLVLPASQIPAELKNYKIKFEFFIAMEDPKTQQLQKIMSYTMPTYFSLPK